jgi:hypothetical protein
LWVVKDAKLEVQVFADEETADNANSARQSEERVREGVVASGGKAFKFAALSGEENDGVELTPRAIVFGGVDRGYSRKECLPLTKTCWEEA